MLTMSQACRVVVTAALALSLGACAAVPPVSSPSPDPSDTPAMFLPLADGDCGALLDPADVDFALGAAATLVTSPVDELPQLAVVGGLRCHWVSGTPGAPGSGAAVLDVVPIAIAEPGEIEGAAATICGQGDTAGCLVDGHTNGWWYELRVTTLTGPDEQSAASRALDGMVQVALSRHTPSQRIEALPAVDCAAAGTEVPGASSQVPLSADQGAPALAADRLARPTVCSFTVQGQRWLVVVFPGTLVPFAQCARDPEGADLALTGVTDAFAPHQAGGLVLCANDGESSVRVSAPAPASATDGWTDALLRVGVGLASPVLAVASA